MSETKIMVVPGGSKAVEVYIPLNQNMAINIELNAREVAAWIKELQDALLSAERSTP